MIEIEIPGENKITLKYLVSDFTGALSVDGILVPGVIEKLNQISKSLEIYILTADALSKNKPTPYPAQANLIAFRITTLQASS